MKSLSPAQSLILLLLVGVAIAGWAYGLHWKRVASGDLFTSDETLMIRLQDQIDTLTEENKVLHDRLRERDGEPETGAAQNVPQPTEPVTLPSSGPTLPAPPQKIETH